MSRSFAPALYAVYSNPLPGREKDLHAWYEEVHIPDSLEEGLFDSVRRYCAVAAGGARFLTLWGCRYASEKDALATVRPVAEKLRASGRIEVVQEVVFQQFVFLEGVIRERAEERAPSLTTIHSLWADPTSLPAFDAWLEDRIATGRLGEGGAARYGVPAPKAKALVVLEDTIENPAGAVTEDAAIAASDLTSGLPPFGEPTPIFEGGSPAPSPPPEATDASFHPVGSPAAWAARWALISTR